MPAKAQPALVDVLEREGAGVGEPVGVDGGEGDGDGLGDAAGEGSGEPLDEEVMRVVRQGVEVEAGRGSGERGDRAEPVGDAHV